jgi:nitrogen fixation/metabolism regulation signal transduction histidine kinase
VITTLTALLLGVSFLILCVDLSLHFHGLDPWSRSALAILSIAGASVLIRPRRWRELKTGVGPSLLSLACGAAILAACGLAQEVAARHVSATWDDGARARLERRARFIQQDFRWLLQEIARPIETAPDAPLDRGAAFEALQRARSDCALPADRLGLAIYRADGSLLAWEGHSARVPSSLLVGEASALSYHVDDGSGGPRLYAFSPARVDGSRWVAEFALQSPVTSSSTGSGHDSPLGFLPHWSRTVPAHIHFGGEHPGDSDLSRFFERQGDRHWGRLRDDGPWTLSLPLRDQQGRQLADVTLTDHHAAERIRAWRATLQLLAALAASAALLVALATAHARGLLRSRTVRLLARSFCLWGVRWGLLLTVRVTDLPELSIFDMSLYSSAALMGLLRSPVDLWLTSLASLLQAGLLRRWMLAASLPEAPRPRRLLRGAAITASLLLAVLGWQVVHLFLDSIVLDARIDLSRVAFDERLLPRLALQASILAIVAALGIVLVTLVTIVVRCRRPDETGRSLPWLLGGGKVTPPGILIFAAAIFFLTLSYVPFLHHAYDRMRRDFLERELMPILLYQNEDRASILGQSLDAATRPDFATVAIFAREEDERAASIAFRLWSMTQLADRALASSLQIFDEGGILLGRFAVGFPPMDEIPFSAAAEVAGGDIVTLSAPRSAMMRKTIISGSRWVRPPRRTPLLVVMSVVDDYDNLPLLGTSSPFLSAFRGRGLLASNPELLRFEPLVAVFGPQLERVHASGGEIPPPRAEVTAGLRSGGSAWSTHDVGDGPARILYVGSNGMTFALAQPHPGPLGLLATYLRHVLLNGALAALAWMLARAARGAARTDRDRSEAGTSFYKRLVGVFLLAALVPLLALAGFVARFSYEEVDDQIVSAGLGSLQAARRVAEDYLRSGAPDEEPALEDDLVFWLSQVIGHDVSVYDQSDLLATSSRELYSSGLLNLRLSGEVYRSLFLDGDAFTITEDAPGGFPSATINAVIRVDAAGSRGVISIPLSAERRAAARRIEQVEDVILISFCLTVLLLIAVGWVMARRVSEPIVHLADAARRLAGGDLDIRVRAQARDEIATLVRAFNQMAGSLQEQQDRLRRRRDYIELILKSATTGVVTIDAEGLIITINPAAQRLLSGSTDDPRTGVSLPQWLQRDRGLGPLASELERAMQTLGERGADLSLGEGADERRLRGVFLPFAPEAGTPPGRILLLEDVTEIVRSGRLAAWADMARRIAHEIKNPLTPIQLSTEHIRRIWRARDPRFDEILSDCLDNIQKQILTLRAIAAEFSAYARLPQLRLEPTSVEILLEEALSPYTTAPPPDLVLERHISPNLSLVNVDRTVLSRVLVNLIENAIQAMPEGGTLSISATARDSPQGAGAVCIEVRDDGAGVEPAILPRLFEPYFSTKSGGTGLGLAIARRAVEEHGGTIEIQSRPGEGTLVRMILPVAPLHRERSSA